MKILALVIAASLASPDGGVSDAPISYVEVKRGMLVTEVDGGEVTFWVDGGSWLDDELIVGFAKELVDKRKRIEVLEANAGRPEAQWLMLAGAVGAVLGIVGATVVYSLKDHK